MHKWLLSQPGLDVSGSSILHLLTWYDFILNASCINFSSVTLRYEVPHCSLSDSCCIDGVFQGYCWFLNPLRVESFKAPLFSFPQETTGKPLPAPLQAHVCYLWLLWASVLPVPCRVGAGAAFGDRPVGNCPSWLPKLLCATPRGESSQGWRQFVVGCLWEEQASFVLLDRQTSAHTCIFTMEIQQGSVDEPEQPGNVRDKEKGFWGCVLCP